MLEDQTIFEPVIGDFIVKPHTGMIVSDSDEISINNRTMAVLVALIEAEGELVSGRELLEKVWPPNQGGGNVVYKAINELREAFGDDAGTPKYIETVPRKGYRLIAPIDETPEIKTSRNPSFSVAIVGVVLAGILGLSVYLLGKDSIVETPFIAVLKFSNIDGHPDNDYIVEGLAEALLNGLAKVPRLRVAAKTDSFRLPPLLSTSEVAADLGVSHVLEGSVQRVGGIVRTTVQLIRVDDGTHVYSEQFDQPVADLLHIQDQIASSVVSSLGVHLDDSQRRQMLDWGTSNAEAYRAYLQGEHWYHQKPSPDAWKTGIAFYNRAIDLDPEFILPYTMLLDVYSWMSLEADSVELEEIREEASKAYLTALSYKPDSEIASSMGLLMRKLSGVQLEGLERQSREEIVLSPDNLQAYVEYGRLLMGARLFNEGMQYIDHMAEQADSFHKSGFEQLKNPGRQVLGRNSEGIAILERSLISNPHNIPNLTGLALMYLQVGDIEQAANYVARLEKSDPTGIWAYGMRLTFQVVSEEASLQDLSSGEMLTEGIDYNYGNGVAYLILGDVDNGLNYWNHLSKQAVESLYYWLPVVELNFPESVITNPSYQTFLDELGIGVAWQKFLVEKVEELEPITGIGLSQLSRESLGRRWQQVTNAGHKP